MRFKKLTVSLDSLDIQKSWGFYEGLGFQKTGQDTDDLEKIVWMEIEKDGINLMLYQLDRNAEFSEFSTKDPRQLVLYIEMEHVVPYYHSLKDRGYPVEEPSVTHYGAIECYLKCPDGHQLTFAEFKREL